MTYKTDKSDETSPGPVYSTEYDKSIKKMVDNVEDKKYSTFGLTQE